MTNRDLRCITIIEKGKTSNGNAAAIDVAPQIIENRTLIPVRAIAEAFGNKVDWNSETKTVTIYN